MNIYSSIFLKIMLLSEGIAKLFIPAVYRPWWEHGLCGGGGQLIPWQDDGAKSEEGRGQAHKEYHLRLPDGGQGHGHHAVDLPRL